MAIVATAATAIGKGILSGFGSEIFSSAFGKREPDFAAILKVALEHFKKELLRSFENELDQREFKAALRHLKTAQRNVRHYNISPATRKDMLDEITFDISDCIGRLERLDERVFASYVIAIGLEISIIQERAKVIGKGELKVSCQTLLEAVQQFEELKKLLVASNNSRFTTVSSNGIPAPGSHGEPSYWEISYRFDGKKVNVRHIPDDRFVAEFPEVTKEVGDLREKHIAAEWKIIQDRLDPLAKLLSDIIEWTEKEGLECKVMIEKATVSEN